MKSKNVKIQNFKAFWLYHLKNNAQIKNGNSANVLLGTAAACIKNATAM